MANISVRVRDRTRKVESDGLMSSLIPKLNPFYNLASSMPKLGFKKLKPKKHSNLSKRKESFVVVVVVHHQNN